jgi:hypothetical protein
MSGQGVILFHDTTVYEGDFGVWRVWDKLKVNYPTFNLRHSHGLGIAYVGVQPSPVAKLLERLSTSEELDTFVNELFKSLGSVAVSHARAELRTKELEAKNQDLRKSLERADASLKQIRSSTLWKIAKPLRRLSPLFKRLSPLFKPSRRATE